MANNSQADSLTDKPSSIQRRQKNFATEISQDSLTSFLIKAQEITLDKKVSSPFNGLQCNKVIAYEYQGNRGEEVIDIVNNGELAPTIKQQKALSQHQVKVLATLLGANSTYGNTYAFCFAPHLGIVFFDDTKVVAHITISLDCNRLRSSIVIPATKVKQIEIDKDHNYPAEGFSKVGRQKIISFFKELNLITSN